MVVVIVMSMSIPSFLPIARLIDYSSRCFIWTIYICKMKNKRYCFGFQQSLQQLAQNEELNSSYRIPGFLFPFFILRPQTVAPEEGDLGPAGRPPAMRADATVHSGDREGGGK